MEMAELQSFIQEAWDTGSQFQALVIAAICGLMVSRFGQVLYYSVIALLLDLLIVPVAYGIYENEWEMSGAVDNAMELINGYIADPKFVVVMLGFFLIATSVVFALKSIVRR